MPPDEVSLTTAEHVATAGLGSHGRRTAQHCSMSLVLYISSDCSWVRVSHTGLIYIYILPSPHTVRDHESYTILALMEVTGDRGKLPRQIAQ